MNHYITSVIVAVVAAMAYLSYRISKELEDKQDSCPEC
ncbi:hypothetical protein HNQ00_001769 [Flavobacterium sp. 14A]|nr:hypothetical protein [Flavobacterium sp. 14A]